MTTTEELEKLNQLFIKRYTDEDEEYIQMTKICSKSPPIVEDWGQRDQKRHYSNNRYGNHYRRDRSPPYYHNKHR